MRFKKFITEQTITSAATSIPQIAGALKKIVWEPNTVNLDIGGGKFDFGSHYLKAHQVVNLIYDPYNRSSKHNHEVISFIKVTPPDTVTVNNVLNVIKEPEARDEVIKLAAQYLKSGGVAYFSVYYNPQKEAGVSKSKDGEALSWQNHMPTKAYVDEIKKHFSSVKVWKDIIIAKN